MNSWRVILLFSPVPDISDKMRALSKPLKRWNTFFRKFAQMQSVTKRAAPSLFIWDIRFDGEGRDLFQGTIQTTLFSCHVLHNMSEKIQKKK